MPCWNPFKRKSKGSTPPPAVSAGKAKSSDNKSAAAPPSQAGRVSYRLPLPQPPPGFVVFDTWTELHMGLGSKREDEDRPLYFKGPIDHNLHPLPLDSVLQENFHHVTNRLYTKPKMSLCKHEVSSKVGDKPVCFRIGQIYVKKDGMVSGRITKADAIFVLDGSFEVEVRFKGGGDESFKEDAKNRVYEVSNRFSEHVSTKFPHLPIRKESPGPEVPSSTAESSATQFAPLDGPGRPRVRGRGGNVVVVQGRG